ncbi:hypothetical protein SLEP1_g33650 [Rubroshorea leprosula]|uniref:Uncharacterized protein n=1 Tax=Rubroshorea leprosula TaxID=152421 RepID=A0AAV5KHA4_9ROSI|nr:hypothetical protein SLEP1_g33650 [Rubroshorea leprosula]
MEVVPIIKEPNTIAESDTNPTLGFLPNSHSSSFLLHNGFGSSQISDIEMITIQSVSYTSLKDMLPLSLTTSPTYNSSWYEIPISNPLVKHAAMAYLQPMSTPREVGGKGVFGMLKEWFCGECGCLAFINDVVWVALKEAFRRGDGLDDEYEHEVD